MEVTTFIWMFVVLKIPVVAALLLIWWAVKDDPQPVAESRDDDGGSHRPDPRGGPRLPRAPRRGPHSDVPLPSPPRVRTVARGRSLAGRER